ncbi:MAG: phosphoadenosine phosphosulfate reductase family protein, partial [Clostridia bacterium]|nr:phosphoadenosine phosphosulfate reductase family protein [Clostridia bacterium]
MKKTYENQNVYEALQQRLKFIFEEFDNIFISFSGGKDSGLLLNILLDFQIKNYPDKKIGVFHQDFEAQYTVTTEYVTITFERIKNYVEPYWVCLPMATRTSVSNYEMFWYPWDDKKKELWVRPMPTFPYVINLENNPITTYNYRMHQEDLSRQFARWYKISHGNKKTVCLLGIRADESLHRYSGIINKRYGYKGQCYITRQFKDVWVASPMYDWSVSDVWHANYKFGYDYNRLYDLYFMAGLTP